MTHEEDREEDGGGEMVEEEEAGVEAKTGGSSALHLCK